MERPNLEEEIDSLEYVYDNLDNVISTLRNLSPSETYSIMISQAQELLNDADNVLIDKQQELDNFSREQLFDLRVERQQREANFKLLQDL